MDLSDIFKQLVWDALVKAALQQLFLAVPLLGWGPIGYVVSWIAVYFTDKLYAVIKLVVDLEVIVLRNEIHKKEFAGAAVRLKLIAKAKGVDSEEFKKARDEQKEALSRFIQFAR